MKMIYLVIGIVLIGGFFFYLTACKTKNSSNTVIQEISKKDTSKVTPPQQFVDLLFAQQTIKEVNQIASGQKVEPNTVWAKYQSVEKFVNDNKKSEAIKLLYDIASSDKLESRNILWAWNGLRELGEVPKRPIVLGLILEVPQQNAIEYLAMYSDKSARYINYTGKVGVWDTHEVNMDKLIADIITKSQDYFNNEKLKTGRNKLTSDKVRFSFLTIAGIYQVEKTFDELTSQKSSIGEIFMTATQVLNEIVTKMTK